MEILKVSAKSSPNLVAGAIAGVIRDAGEVEVQAIGAGAGNPPVVVDETADIEKAGKDIISGCTFDNNLPCIAEKECFVINTVADKLIESMQRNGAYLLNEKQIKELEEESSNPDFWNDSENSTKVLQKLKASKDKVENFEKLLEACDDIEVSIETDLNKIIRHYDIHSQTNCLVCKRRGCRQ